MSRGEKNLSARTLSSGGSFTEFWLFILCMRMCVSWCWGREKHRHIVVEDIILTFINGESKRNCPRCRTLHGLVRCASDVQKKLCIPLRPASSAQRLFPVVTEQHISLPVLCVQMHQDPFLYIKRRVKWGSRTLPSHDTFGNEVVEIVYINAYKSVSLQQNSFRSIAFITETPCRD